MLKEFSQFEGPAAVRYGGFFGNRLSYYTRNTNNENKIWSFSECSAVILSFSLKLPIDICKNFASTKVETIFVAPTTKRTFGSRVELQMFGTLKKKKKKQCN